MVKRSSQTALSSLLLLVSESTVAAAYALFFRYALTTNQAIEYEGPCLWASTQIAHGLNAYPLETLTQSPYTVIIYPPLYFLLCSLFEHSEPNYLLPRLISMAATVFTAVFYYKFLRCYNQVRTSTGGTILLMSFMAIWLWSAKGRVDELSLALSALSLMFYGISQKSDKATLPLILSGLTLSLAVMTKQPSALLAPALILDLLIARRIKDAITFTTATGVSLLSMLGLAQMVTAGGFIAHMRFASHMPFEWRFLSERLALMYVDWPKFILAMLAIPAAFIYSKKIGVVDSTFGANIRSQLRLALLLVATTLPVTFYTAGTAYSNVNHFLVLLLPLPLLIAALVESLTYGQAALTEPPANQSQASSQLPERLPALTGVVPRVLSFMYGSTLLLSGFLLLFLSLALFNPTACEHKLELTRAVSPTELKTLMQGKLVLSEDGGYGPLYGCTTEPVDITTFIQVMGVDGAQAKAMLKNVEAKKYAVVVINHQEMTGSRKMAQWDKAVIAAIKSSYHLYGQTNGNCEVQDVYLP